MLSTGWTDEGPNGTIVGDGIKLNSGEADITYANNFDAFIMRHFTYLHPVDNFW